MLCLVPLRIHCMLVMHHHTEKSRQNMCNIIRENIQCYIFVFQELVDYLQLNEIPMKLKSRMKKKSRMK